MRVSEINLGNVTASLVVSEYGDHVGSDGTSRSLGGQADFDWFIGLRNRAAVILTSGKTFRDESYREPKNSHLAVFSRNHDIIDPIDNMISIGPEQASSFEGAVQYLLAEGYGSIHCEFGPTGFIALARAGFVECYLSSESISGIKEFSEQNSINCSIVADDHLVIARVGSVAVL